MITQDQEMLHAVRLQNAGQLVQAEKILQKILISNPSHAYALHLLGIIAYQVGKINLGINLIEQAIHANPNVALFYSNLGEMYRKLNVLDVSIKYGHKAIALEPNSATALANLGIAYYDAQEYSTAEVYHKRALEINPNLSCALNNMGSIYKSYAKTQQAIAFYQAASAASPYLIEPLNNLSLLFLQQQEFKQALTHLNKIVSIDPNFIDAYCNLGLTFLGLEQCENAVLYFKKALQINPDYAAAFYGLAKVSLYQQDFATAEFYVQKALMLDSQQVEYYQLLANIYLEKGCYSDALMCIEKALKIDPNISNLHLSQGNIWMEMGEIDKAEAQFLKLTQDPKTEPQIYAHYCLVQLRKVKPDNVSVPALLSILKSQVSIPSNQLEYLYFALGKCYDDLGEYPEAFGAFTKGCKLKRQRINYNIAADLQFTSKLMAHFTPQLIEHLKTFANPSALPIFIVGMPRSGSTLVEQILSRHPKVHAAGELKYLNNLLKFQTLCSNVVYPENIVYFTHEIWNSIIEKYLSDFQNIAPHANYITDKMPNNFIAIGLIHAIFPNAKIIHIKRNPKDTCLSCYTKLFTQGQLYSYDLTELGQYYQCYARIMQHWRQILPKNAWLDLEYEELIKNTKTEAERLISFCDLPWHDDCLTFYQSKRQVRTASFTQVRQPIYTSSVERWRRYEKELEPLLKILPHEILI